uniref:Protein GPR107 n=1 Tax=Haemonchus contortus TaxID=6289 RepID=A0A7I4Z662_HAECO
MCVNYSRPIRVSMPSSSSRIFPRNVCVYFDQELESISISVRPMKISSTNVSIDRAFKNNFDYEFCFGRCARDANVAEPVNDDVDNGSPLPPVRTRRDGEGWLDKFKRILSGGDSGKPYKDFVPLEQKDLLYSANISIRFPYDLRGNYHFIYHNCFNYRAHGYSDRVAVDFTVWIVERNVGSFLSAGDIPKPQLFIYVSLAFVLSAALWCRLLCLSSHANVYRVHGLMTALIFLKAASLFFHGVNYFFVSKYGQQSEIWAVVYYITHLLKGALLFGTIILIGTGYTFFKNFLTERDRKVFMVVLPLQIVDNIAMVILEESEFGQQGYQLWFEMFVFIDMVCCFLIIFPIIWSMHHLSEGARSDGKAAFNLEKLRLFRHFYMIVISYVYLTRVMKLLLQYALPFDQEWITDAVVELSTLIFFILVGILFRPQPANPYLKLNQDIDDTEDISLTQNGLLEGVVNRGSSNALIAPDTGNADLDCPTITVEDNLNVSQLGRRRVDGFERTLL